MPGHGGDQFEAVACGDGGDMLVAGDLPDAHQSDFGYTHSESTSI